MCRKLLTPESPSSAASWTSNKIRFFFLNRNDGTFLRAEMRDGPQTTGPRKFDDVFKPTSLLPTKRVLYFQRRLVSCLRFSKTIWRRRVQCFHRNSNESVPSNSTLFWTLYGGLSYYCWFYRMKRCNYTIMFWTQFCTAFLRLRPRHDFSFYVRVCLYLPRWNLRRDVAASSAIYPWTRNCWKCHAIMWNCWS